MKDKHHRTITYMRVSLTDRCNLRCRYCMPAKGISWIPHEEIMRYEEILEVLKIVSTLGIHKIRLTGGEPLVRKDIVSLIKNIKTMTSISEVNMTTNGILLSEVLEELVEAGLDSINVSLDTIHPVRFQQLTRGGKVEKVIQALQDTKKYEHLKVKLNCVPHTQNETDILDMVAFAREMEMPLRFIELMPIGYGKNKQGKSQQELVSLLEQTYGEVLPYTSKMGNGPAVYFKIQATGQIIGFISALTHKFCHQCNRVRLTADGYLKGCLQYQGGIHIKSLLQQKTEQEVKEEIEKCIYHKPKAHQFFEKKILTEESKEMYKIGG